MKSEMRRVLRKLPIKSLASVSAAVRQSLKDMGIDNIYDLTVASSTDLLRAKGLGPSTLRKIRTELTNRGVETNW